MPIDFQKAKEDLKRRQRIPLELQFGKDLTSLLKDNFGNINLQDLSHKELLEEKDFTIAFRNYFLKSLFEKNLLSTFTVLAILYLEDVLEKNLQSNQIVNFYALDYFQKYSQTHNIYLLKEGGDLCLLKSSIFPGRQKFIRKKDYMFFGKQFYYHYFKNTDNGVFASLSDYFDFYASNLEKFFNLFKTKS